MGYRERPMDRMMVPVTTVGKNLCSLPTQKPSAMVITAHRAAPNTPGRPYWAAIGVNTGTQVKPAQNMTGSLNPRGPGDIPVSHGQGQTSSESTES